MRSRSAPGRNAFLKEGSTAAAGWERQFRAGQGAYCHKHLRYMWRRKKKKGLKPDWKEDDPGGGVTATLWSRARKELALRKTGEDGQRSGMWPNGWLVSECSL